MNRFAYSRPDDIVQAVAARDGDPAAYLAGGTSLLDLMKLDVRRPKALVDINGLGESAVSTGPAGLRIGAFARMADVAEHSEVKRDYPVIAQSLLLAASAQIRNMAHVGGNLLQSTRCSYFRDVSFACNRRTPGAGCSAIGGNNRGHAVLGGSTHCIATYPGDLAQALVALDATIDLHSASGTRTIALADLHRLPDDTPQAETNLRPGEMITAINVPAGGWTRRSLYVKVRERASYSFALASAAIALQADGKRIQDIRIALGGVATIPWRARAAEALLRQKDLSSTLAEQAAEIAFADARSHGHNAFKIALGKQTLVRGLMAVAELDIS